MPSSHTPLHVQTPNAVIDTLASNTKALPCDTNRIADTLPSPSKQRRVREPSRNEANGERQENEQLPP